MKLFDKIIYYFFWIHILGILIQFAIIPLFISKPEFVESLFFGDRRELMNNILIPFALIGTTFWVYCFWFYMKYDSRSNKWFALLFFNWIYAPIYYYEVKIKKRPLIGRETYNCGPIIEDNVITDTEFIEFTRQNIFGVIDLWSSKQSQIDYQKNVPIAHVSAELYCQWNDFYIPNSDDFQQAFKDSELKILSEFDSALNDSVDKTPETLPTIEDFIDTEEWKKMNTKAVEIKEKLNTVGYNA